MQGTVLRAQSGFYWVSTAEGVLECTLRGRLKKERQQADIAVIGDEVQVTRLDQQRGVIEAVAERRSRFSRRQPGSRGAYREDVLIANLDLVVLIFACAQPAPHLRKLDRFLVIAEQNEIEPLIVANKVDLVGMAQARTLFGTYAAIGYQVVYTSVNQELGIAELRERITGRISVFTGSSGVGKSSLLNSLQPGLQLRTAEVSELLTKGRHTTTVAELIPLTIHGGGYVADTPGIREIGLWQLDGAELDWCFPEMRPFLGACYFAGCTHIHEPDCAVRAALAEGQIDPERYESYVRLRMHTE